MRPYTWLLATLRVALIAGSFSIGQALAGPVVIEPESAVPRLRVSAGVTVRSLEADFRLNGASRSLGGPATAPGLFAGGSGRVIYEDGSIGPSFETVAGNAPDGTAFGTIQRADQLFDTGRFDGNGSPIFGARFQGVQSSIVTVTDEETSAGPFLQIAYSLVERDGLLLNAVTGWSWVRFGLSSGDQLIRSEFTYTYDTTLINPLPSFPFTDPASAAGLGVFLIDADNPAIAGFGIDPRGEIRATGIARADLDVDLNEIPIGLEFGKEFGRLDLLLTAGLTLNAITFDFDSELSWKPAGSPVTVQRWRNEGSELKAGGYLGLVGRYPLCASGRVFTEVRGSYRWVDSMEVSAGFASAEIDPSSWEGGFGIGVLW